MADSRPLIRLRLETEDEPEGEIALADLARIANATQTFMRQIARSLVGKRGPGASQSEIVRASSLRLVGLKAGSTVLEIAGASLDEDALDYDFPTDLTELTFDMLLGGLTAVSDSAGPAELPIGYDRHLVDNLDDLLRSIRSYKSVSVEAHIREKTGRVTASPKQARARLHALSPQPVLPYISPTEQALEGKLYAVNLNTGSFSIEDDAGHKIRTDVPTNLRDAAANLISRRVRAVGRPQLDEGRLKSFEVSRLGPAPDLTGLSEQKGFFEPHELEVKPPVGERGTLDEWAISGLTEDEADAFMEALTATR